MNDKYILIFVLIAFPFVAALYRYANMIAYQGYTREGALKGARYVFWACVAISVLVGLLTYLSPVTLNK